MAYPELIGKKIVLTIHSDTCVGNGIKGPLIKQPSTLCSYN